MKTVKALIAAALLAGAAAQAAPYPDKPIRLVVPLAPGGTTDMVARMLGERMGRELGQPVVIENRGGAGGSIGSDYVAKAPADGYTLLMGTIGTLAVTPSLYESLPYDSDTAFAPVALATHGQFVLVVNPAVPAHSVDELLAQSRADPQGYNYGSAGNGSTPHLGTELLQQLTGTDMVHVPYRGSGPMVSALLAGEVQVGMPDLPSALAHIRSGKLRALAVTSRQRAGIAADIPTLQESGIAGFDVVSWLGILAPAGTPRPIVDRLNSAIRASLSDPDMRARLAQIDTTVDASTPDEFAAFIKAERKKWDEVVRRSGATVN